VEEISESI